MDLHDLTQRVTSDGEDGSYVRSRSEKESTATSELVSQSDDEREKIAETVSPVNEHKLPETVQIVNPGAHIYTSDKNNRGIIEYLYFAVEKRDKGIIKLLLNGGADMTIKTKYGRSPLEFARNMGDQEIIKMLTYRKINVPEDSGCLLWAATLAYLMPVRYDGNAFQRRFERLFGTDSSLEIVKKTQEIIQGYIPVSNYAAVRNDKTLKALVTEKFRNKVVDEMSSQQIESEVSVTLNDIIDCRNENFVTAGTFQEEFLKEFTIEIGECDINIDIFKPEKFNETSVKLISDELDKIPDLDKVKKFKFTAYLKCMRDPKSWCGNREIQAVSRVLLSNVHVFSDGTDQSIIDEGNTDQMQLFNNGGLHYNFGLIRAPVLAEAIKNRREQEAKTYLSFGVDDVDYKNGDGWTSMHFAAQLDYPEIIESLLAQGASASVKDCLYQTPLDVAMTFNGERAANVLTKKSEVEVCDQQSEEEICGQQTEGVSRQKSEGVRNQRPDAGVRTEHDCDANESVTGQNKENVKLPHRAMPNKPEIYKRSDGEGGLGGQIYEIELSMLFLLQGLTRTECGKIESFYLATNLSEAEDFDDVVFRYKYKDENGSVKSKVIYLQAKHKEHPESAKEKITFEKLFSKSGKKGDFALWKYFRSYLDIKNCFSKEGQDSPIFEGNFKDLDCDFIIYTNASSILSKTAQIIEEIKVDGSTKVYWHRIKEIDGYYVKEVNLNEDSFLYLEGKSDNNRYYELIFDGIKTDKITDVLQTAWKNEDGNINATEESATELKQDLSIKAGMLCEELGNETGLPEDHADTSLHTASPIVTEIKCFLRKLKIFVEQPGEEELCTIIKQKIKSVYQVEENDANSIFSDVRNKVEGWWKEEKNYLTEDNRFFKESVKISIFFDVRKPGDLFVGREKEMSELHDTLQCNSGKITVVSQNPDVCGAAGIGKTELALNYVCKYSQDYDNNIIWINAESYETLVDSFCRLAQDKLKIKAESVGESNIEMKSIVEEVYKYFAKRKSLFIFDNAEIDIDKFLPPLSSNENFKVLITSRSAKWDNAGIFPLDVLTEPQAQEFIRRALAIEYGSDREVKQLSDTLQRLPLALQQAVTYIREENTKLKTLGEEFTIDDYLKKYEKEETKINLLLDSTLFDDNCCNKAIFITWKITLEKIRELHFAKEAFDILDVIAHFAPNANSTNLFFKSIINKRSTDSSLELLRQYSIIASEQLETDKHKPVEEVIIKCVKGKKKDTEVLRQSLALLETTAGGESCSRNRCTLC